VGIDGHDLAEAVACGNRGEADRGLAFEAADFEDRALPRGTGGGKRQEARFALSQEARRGANQAPRRVDRREQVRR
jgi:hypothetical protein